MGDEEEAGAIEEGVGGKENDRVYEDGGPDCCCELYDPISKILGEKGRWENERSRCLLGLLLLCL